MVVLGGLTGWYLTGSQGAHSLTSGRPSSQATPPGAGGAAQAATAEPSTPPPSPSTPVVSPTAAASATAPTGGTQGTGGSAVVALSPGVSGQPAAAAIATFLGQYFTAINQHDYQAYISLFTPAAQQGNTVQKFSSGYATTSDSSETLVEVSPAHHGKTPASVTFVSHQAPQDSPTHSACTIWRITLFLRSTGTSYLIGKGPGSYHASMQACP